MSIEIGTQAPPLQLDTDGVVRVGGTRVTLDSVVTAFSNGASAEEIVQQFPTLGLPDVYAVIAYYLGRQEEVERYLDSRREQAARIRADNETKSDQKGIRDRLMARREKGS
ncbi:MAG: DUF433 domain-containing protein [Acidobacteria bacterium]|nr:MAG: DUF433 domain-containing protein [Acidobacteriota bacterium]